MEAMGTTTMRDGKWVTEREMAALLSISVHTLRLWRHHDKRDGRRRGNLIYRKFHGAVRYFVAEDLLDPRATHT
jgi:hypothetical protein